MQNDTGLVLSGNDDSPCSDSPCSDSPCAIQTLPPELLWLIFMKNTEVDASSHNRLHTARRSSQVCRRWREHLLGFPSVWGRLLDLDYYEPGRDDWREEVLSRAGDALLWITGSVTQSTWSFFFAVLEKKWQNVEVLDVICTWNPAPGFRSAIRPILFRDAPNLVSISLRIRSAAKDPSKSHSPILFNGFAPRLRHLRVFREFYFDATAPWLSTLYSVILFPYHPAPMILSILKSTPLLRHLKIVRGADKMLSSMEYTDLGIVSMQHLDSLELSGCPMYLESLLGSIDLPSGRAAKLRKLSIGTCNHQHSELAIWTLERVQCTIMKWIQSYMDDFPPKNIYISERQVPGSTQTVYMRETQTLVAPEGSNSLYLRISLAGPFRPLILNLAASSNFSAVRELQTCANISVEPLIPLYKAFCSVTVLSIDLECSTQQFLDAIDQYSLFPSLRTLRWDGYGALWDANANTFPRLMKFVENRASIGLPLSTLYLVRDRVHSLGGFDKSRLYGTPGLVVELTDVRLYR